jgi:ribosomal protein S18 acetylase RimI-like enzyme
MPSIRPARSEDLEKLAAVERSAGSLFRQTDLAWIADDAVTDPALLEKACRDRRLWVAVGDDGEPVGFLVASEMDGDLYIAELSVAASHQRQGIGTRLIDAAAEHGRKAGYGFMTLTTYRDIPWNGPLYRRLGFVEVDVDYAGSDLCDRLRQEVAAGHDPCRRSIMAKRL